MYIAGEWFPCDDGVVRPVLTAEVSAADGDYVSERFLIDTGADRTVFSASLLFRLQFPLRPVAPELAVVGVGGRSSIGLVRTSIFLPRQDGQRIRVHGEFAGLLEPTAVDLSILGRDVLENFDLVCGRRGGEILLLAGNHGYQVIAL